VPPRETQRATDSAAAEAVFFDIRDTLGVVDRTGHMVKYKPTTDLLLEAMKQVVGLRIGLITNLPQNVSSDEGKAMVKEAGIWPFLDARGWVTNHDAGVDKPKPEIFAYAARQMELPPERCVFVGENLMEVIGAQAAGMRTVLKPFPPGREFLNKPIKPLLPDAKSSGRLSEIIMEEDHLVGKRIVGAGIKIAERLASGPEAVMANRRLLRAVGILVWLTRNFIDPFHHRKEEEVLIPLALARGLDPRDCAFVSIEHEQGRTYFRGMAIALERIHSGDAGAVGEFGHLLQGFIALYKEHGRKEDDELFKKLGDVLTDVDDGLIVDLMARIGPADITLYLALIGEMEAELAS